jgi:hypothetical protein
MLPRYGHWITKAQLVQFYTVCGMSFFAIWSTFSGFRECDEEFWWGAC